MSRNSRVAQAFRAMKIIGVDEDKVRPVLKRLLQVYDKNWDMIEAENYRVLADAIFDEDDKVPERKKCTAAAPEEFDDDDSADEPEHPLKRIRLRHQQDQPSTSGGNLSPTSIGTSSKMPKEEADELPHGSDLGPESLYNSGDGRTAMELTSSGSASLNHWVRNKGKEPLSADVASGDDEYIPQEKSLALCTKEPESLPRTNLLLMNCVPETQALMIPKEEPVNEIVHDEVPLAVIHPDASEIEDSSIRKVLAEEEDARVPPASEPAGEEKMFHNGSAVPSEQRPCSEVARVSEFPPSLEVASSGEVKIYLSCNSAHGRSNFHMPSLDELIKLMEDRCLRSYKILDPKFSVINLMKDMCECFQELGTDCSNESQEELRIEVPNDEVLKKSSLRDSVGGEWNRENIFMPPTVQDGSFAAQCSVNGSLKNRAGNELVVVTEHHLGSDDLRSINNRNDITKGEERVPVPWVNEISRDLLPSFYYISQNLVFQSACINFSLSRIKDGSCCPTCFGDCLLSATPCHCHLRGGKEFAYTTEGVVKEDFLDECFSMIRDPQKQSFLNCSVCPLEKSKNDEFLEPCKGHLKRKVIKECCCKCGCSKLCGNRVLQRGITYRLEVFFTHNGKGWGLRTLEKLPKGAFVCEFVGEILTVSELYARNAEERAHLVLLDTNWPLKGASKEEEALCLDATSYGNVSRFINHRLTAKILVKRPRCLDASLIEIPVEVDTRDLHYYRLAFFTTREVNALEELTWDYGIDFDDQDNPIKGFQCKCGSKFCRNMKRSGGSRSAKIIT